MSSSSLVDQLQNPPDSFPLVFFRTKDTLSLLTCRRSVQNHCSSYFMQKKFEELSWVLYALMLHITPEFNTSFFFFLFSFSLYLCLWLLHSIPGWLAPWVFLSFCDALSFTPSSMSAGPFYFLEAAGNTRPVCETPPSCPKPLLLVPHPDVFSFMMLNIPTLVCTYSSPLSPSKI